MSEVKFNIIKELGVISDSGNGWRKELNLVSWNNRAPKYDIRDWSDDHEKAGKGITLSADEVKALQDALGWLEL